MTVLLIVVGVVLFGLMLGTFAAVGMHDDEEEQIS